MSALSYYAVKLPSAYLLLREAAHWYGGMVDTMDDILPEIKIANSPALNALRRREEASVYKNDAYAANNRTSDSFGNLASALDAIPTSPWDK